MPHRSTLCFFLIQIRNVGTGLCADTKHGALGSPLRLESCVRGRGEAAWNNMQVRAAPQNHSWALCCPGLQWSGLGGRSHSSVMSDREA